MKYQKSGEALETTKCYGPRSRSEDPNPALNYDREVLDTQKHMSRLEKRPLFLLFKYLKLCSFVTARGDSGQKAVRDLKYFEFYEILKAFSRRSFKIS
jgi:hypothetical protein